MPKPFLREPFATLEKELIETMIGGLHEWRSDLHYPESHSDMAGCIRAVLRKYEVKLRPVVLDRAEIMQQDAKCPVCNLKMNGGHVVSLNKPVDFPGDFYAHYDCVVLHKEKT
jgi:hypothetical protein